MAYVDLAVVAKGIQGSSTMANTLNSFFAKGGVIGYNQPGEGTRYVSNDVAGKAGTILIDPTHPSKMLSWTGSELEATRDLIIHELGHFQYELQDKAMFSQAQTSVDARIDYCFTREAEASVFAFQVARELKSVNIRAEVPGTAANADLYSLMATVFNSSTQNLLNAVKSQYANDKAYAEYCQKNFGKVNAYIPPDGTEPMPGSDGDGTDATGPAGTHGAAGGSGGVSIGPYVPPSTPIAPPSGGGGGGYWQPIPAPTPGPVTDSIYPDPYLHSEMVNVELVGISACNLI